MLLEYFKGLSRREQVTVTVAIPLITALLFWLLLLQPILTSNKQLHDRFSQKNSALLWMTSASGKVAAMGTVNNVNGRPQVFAHELRQVMTQLILSQRIAIKRIQNRQNGDISFNLGDSTFDQVLRVIQQSTERGVKIVQLQLNKEKIEGKVNSHLIVSL